MENGGEQRAKNDFPKAEKGLPFSCRPSGLACGGGAENHRVRA